MTDITTTRAYKLKLTDPRPPDQTDQQDWRRDVWKTHYIVNRGVWVWGDWLLTLRGGLSASLADGKSDRRVVLALSWLSVEAPHGLVPQEYRLSDLGAKEDKDKDRVVAQFKKILAAEGVEDVDAWVDACEPALRAKIRTDAVWVDRWSCFQALSKQYPELTQSWAEGTLVNLLGGETTYFNLPDLDNDSTDDGKDFSQKAGNWLSRHWGSGEKSDPEDIVKSLENLSAIDAQQIVGVSGTVAIETMRSHLQAKATGTSDGETPKQQFKELKSVIGWGTGRESAGALALKKIAAKQSITAAEWDGLLEKFTVDREKLQKKIDGPRRLLSMPKIRKAIESHIGMPFRVGKDLTWQYAVMLDHALRRLSGAHSWIKRAEVERAKFSNDAKNLESIIDPVRNRLDDYCERRSTDSGAAEPYIIRKRAIEGWADVLKAWRRSDCNGVSERQRAVRNLQAEGNKKFDVNLMLALAEDDAEIVWRDRKSNYLADYSAAQIAFQNQMRFKVPAYRHPDPLRHPVWVDFGNSRWDIEYAVQAGHKPAGAAATKRDKNIKTKKHEAEDAVRRQKVKIEEAKATFKKAKSEPQKATRQQNLELETCRLQRYEEQADWLNSSQGVELKLWSGERINKVRLQWRNKRLENDLCLENPSPHGRPISRADRLGRAAGGWPGDLAKVAALFDTKQWPGRLQSDRRRFDRWACHLYGGKNLDATAEIYDSDELRHPWDSPHWKQLPWYLSYSATLESHGPIYDAKFLKSLKNAGWVYQKIKQDIVLYHPGNKEQKRSGPTRLKLPHVEDMRVLSFDLGLRFAASCTVWHVLSQPSLISEIAGRQIENGGYTPNDLFVHTAHTDSATGKVRKTIYRRLSPEWWARLDRQFTIKLPGEDRPSRKANQQEVAIANDIADRLGGDGDARANPGDPPRIADLHESLFRQLRHGLRDHSNLARAANAMQASSKTLAGGQTYHFFQSNASDDTVTQRSENYRKFLAAGLVCWRQLVEREPCVTSELKTLFDTHFGTEDLTAPSKNESPIQIKQREKKLAEQLMPAAERLANDPELRGELAEKLSRLWKLNDQRWRGRDGLLRAVRRLIIPRLGKKPVSTSPELATWQEKKRALKNVGGLSLQRIATMRGLYQVMRAYHCRPAPEDLHAGIRTIEKDAENGFRFGVRILEAMEGMRTNRVKQLASRLVEAALGIGSENRMDHWNGRQRPNRQIFPPCHIIVGENLENYKPDQKRFRAENRNVQRWCARNVRKFIREACELHGLYFAEAPAQYTSLQDSRTGAWGLRCREMTAQQFLDTSWLRVRVNRIQQRLAVGDEVSPADRWLAELQQLAEKFKTSGRQHTLIRFIAPGADLFVSQEGTSPAANGLQADLNAAANIGLRNLLHPDWPGSWAYIPVRSKSGATDPNKFPGSPLLAEAIVLLPNEQDRKDAANEILNAWSIPSADSLTKGRHWKPRKQHWLEVEQQVVQRLRNFVRRQQDEDVESPF